MFVTVPILVKFKHLEHGPSSPSYTKTIYGVTFFPSDFALAINSHFVSFSPKPCLTLHQGPLHLA